MRIHGIGWGDYFMKSGKISGAEFYCVSQSPDQILVGVDDVSLYNSSYDLYSEVFAAYNRFSDQIKYIDRLCEAVLEQKVSQQGREIISNAISMYGDFAFEEFVRATEKYWHEMPVDSIPQIIRDYINALQEQETLSASLIQDQEDRLYAELINSLSSDDKSILMQSYVRCGLGEISKGTFLISLLTKAEEAGYAIDEYEMLIRARDMYGFFENVDEQELFFACRQLSDVMKQEFMSEEEQEYASVIDTWTVVKKILSLELTRERFEQFGTSQIDTLFFSYRCLPS